MIEELHLDRSGVRKVYSSFHFSIQYFMSLLKTMHLLWIRNAWIVSNRSFQQSFLGAIPVQTFIQTDVKFYWWKNRKIRGSTLKTVYIIKLWSYSLARDKSFFVNEHYCKNGGINRTLSYKQKSKTGLQK